MPEMNKIILIAFLFLPCFLFAQNKNNKDTTNTALSTVEQNKTVDNKAALASLAEELAGKNNKIKHLEDSIGKLHEMVASKNKEFKTKIKLDSTNNSSKLGLYQERIKKDSQKIGQLSKRIKELETINNARGTIDEDVFNLFLLHSLEIRYNEKYIEDALKSLEALNIPENPKYKKYCDVYIPLLEYYKQLNQDVIDFFKREQNSFNMKRWAVNNMVKEGALKEFQKISYYKYYKQRNESPYQSIPYLDYVIDDFYKMMEGKLPLNEKSFQKLIDRLTPRVGNK